MSEKGESGPKRPIFIEKEAQNHLESVLYSLIKAFGEDRVIETLNEISTSNKPELK
jgi:mannitol/fructose-specific phosphotransferase system IIA component (Ntr-type)